MKHSLCLTLSLPLSFFPAAALAQPPAPGVAIRQIDFTLQPRSSSAVWTSALKGPHATLPQTQKYRIKDRQRPATAGEEERKVSVYRLKLAFEPLFLPGSSTTQSPASKIRDMHAAIAIHRPLSKIAALSMEWQAARLASYDGNVTADGSKAYRDKTSDYFLPQLALSARLAPGLTMRASHRESLQINMDAAIFGPRAMPMEEWTATGRGIDFQRRTTNSVALSWNVTDALAFRGHAADIRYRNRIMANHRGLLRPLPGTSRAQEYGGGAEWRIAPKLRLNVEAMRENMRDTSALNIAGHRDKWSVGMERSGQSHSLRIAVGRQSAAHFGQTVSAAATQITFRPEWTIEASADQRLSLIDGLPEMAMRLEARTAPDFGSSSTDQMAGLSSREIQPQIRLSLNTRW
ncbi:MAG: hypothetical protein R3E11_00780 [Sphingobium sp.]|nr:hypothetical protein [Sphingobium sp.]MCP5400084.1 hypothetical protein [Sphingomonas sp.]